MVAYSFKRQFIRPILDCSKMQTIRAPRKRHARAGEELQLYTAMRTKACRAIGIATCASVDEVTLDFSIGRVAIDGSDVIGTLRECDAFARLDGFQSWLSMATWWASEHDISKPWRGVLIRWYRLQPNKAVFPFADALMAQG